MWEQGDIVYRCTTLRSHLCVKGRCVCTVNKRGETESAAEPCQDILSVCQGGCNATLHEKIWTGTTLCMKAQQYVCVILCQKLPEISIDIVVCSPKNFKQQAFNFSSFKASVLSANWMSVIMLSRALDCNTNYASRKSFHSINVQIQFCDLT